METKKLINETIAFVKKTLEGAEGGHDWFHIERVYQNAKNIGTEEKADLLIISLAALLHDIADAKFYNGDETIGPKMARDFLVSKNVSKAIIEHVVAIINHISFKSSLEATPEKEKFTSLELQVVQDADRLDAIGAIGIARTFNYGGFKNRTIYNPDILPNLEMTKEDYKKSTAPSINHFYEKLLLLKDKMNTVSGKKLAVQRHQFMVAFLNQFYLEWNGKS